MSDRRYSGKGNGYGDGHGFGESYGYGSGFGFGTGYGYGHGEGDGRGSTYGSGHIDLSTDTRPFEEIASEYEQSAPATSIYRPQAVRGDCEGI